jgi:hypothetical protein
MGMRLLKAFVIIGGLVLVVGTGVLFTRMYEKFNAPSEKLSKKAGRERHITIPADGEILSSSPVGEGVAVLVKRSAGGGQLLFVNRDGQLWRRIHLEAAPLPASKGILDATTRDLSSHGPEN